LRTPEIWTMNDTLDPGMREASRLTRAGRLIEATVLLQRMLRRDLHPASSTGSVPRTIDLVAETVDVTDLVQSLRTGQEFDSGTRNQAERAGHSYLPEPLRRVLDRIPRTGFEPGLGGLAEPSPADAPDVPQSGQFLVRSYSNQAGIRAYKLYVPSGYRRQPLPLIIMLHGCTQSPDDFAAGTRMNLRAEEHNCFVAYPAQAATANSSKCWNWFRPGDQERDQGEPSLIAGITRQVMSDYSVDPDRVFAAGFSAGAAATAILAATYPDLYAAVGVHSGLACGAASDVASAFAAMRQNQPASRHRSGRRSGGSLRIVPAIVFHGDEDMTVHPHNGDQVTAQLREALNIDSQATVEKRRVPGGRAYSRMLYHDASGQAMFEQWVIHGAGHAWSGGSPAGSYTDPKGPDATREMLRFFLDHPQL
jgi:poly(hydroxyalkanoate) depolymerase family esterase